MGVGVGCGEDSRQGRVIVNNGLMDGGEVRTLMTPESCSALVKRPIRSSSFRGSMRPYSQSMSQAVAIVVKTHVQG